MRKFTLFLLLAATAMPATAQRDDPGDRQSRRSVKADNEDNRPQRAERAERREAREQRQLQVSPQVQAAGPSSERIQRYQQQQQQQQQQVNTAQSERVQRYQQRLQGQQQQVTTQRSERLQRYQQRRVEGGELAPRQSRIRTIPTTSPQAGQAGPVRSDVRVGTSHYRGGDRNRWTNQWRNDRRYDWRRHRDRNRSIFHLGFYYDPFGYGYQRFGIGSFLFPNYYQSNYWINDPWQYRLPPAYGPYRWVRYHNDAILIDTWTGEVVDVIYGFFW